MQLTEEQIKKIMPDFSVTQQVTELTKEELCNNLLMTISVPSDMTAQEKENFICNYIYTVNAVKQDLATIENTIRDLKQMESDIPADEDYLHKKIRYFLRMNQEAKDETIGFITNKLNNFVAEHISYKFSDRESDGLSMLFFKMRYEYSYFSEYYDINYDFSTEAKFRFIPGNKLVELPEIIKKYVKMHREEPEKYAKVIDDIVTKNDSIGYIKDNIKSNYVLCKRTELFETLVELYKAEKYQTYITLATIQLEGVFSDCCDILNKKNRKNNTGTLIEKAERVFEDKRIKQALFPHYAYTVPILRNEIAHKGMIDATDLFHLANEVTLDLYTIVYWANRLVIDKYFAITQAYEKVQSADTQIEETTFYELYMSYPISDIEYINVIAKPEEYEEELAFYKSLIEDEDRITFKEMVSEISRIVKSESFWRYIRDTILPMGDDLSEVKKFGIIDFVKKLRNAVIPILRKDSPEKIMCQEVSKELEAILKAGEE